MTEHTHVCGRRSARTNTYVGTLRPRGLCGHGGCVLASPLWSTERKEKLRWEGRIIRGRGHQRALCMAPSNENEICGRMAVATGSALRYGAMGTEAKCEHHARHFAQWPSERAFLVPVLLIREFKSHN